MEEENKDMDGRLENTTAAAAADDDRIPLDKWVGFREKGKLREIRWEVAKEKKSNRVRAVRIPLRKSETVV